MISEYFERKIMPKILRYSSQTSYVNCSLSLGTDGSSPLWWETSMSLDDCEGLRDSQKKSWCVLYFEFLVRIILNSYENLWT